MKKYKWVIITLAVVLLVGVAFVGFSVWYVRANPTANLNNYEAYTYAPLSISMLIPKGCAVEPSGTHGFTCQSKENIIIVFAEKVTPVTLVHSLSNPADDEHITDPRRAWEYTATTHSLCRNDSYGSCTYDTFKKYPAITSVVQTSKDKTVGIMTFLKGDMSYTIQVYGKTRTEVQSILATLQMKFSFTN